MDGVVAHPAANGDWNITVIDANSFSLNGSAGQGGGVYTSGGTWTEQGTITNATNTGPIVITSANHGLSSGALINITGVLGNPAANANWTITVIDANTFSLNGSAGHGADP